MKYLIFIVAVGMIGCVSADVTAPVDPSRCHTTYKTRMGGAFQEVTVCEPALPPPTPETK